MRDVCIPRETRLIRWKGRKGGLSPSTSPELSPRENWRLPSCLPASDVMAWPWSQVSSKPAGPTTAVEDKTTCLGAFHLSQCDGPDGIPWALAIPETASDKFSYPACQGRRRQRSGSGAVGSEITGMVCREGPGHRGLLAALTGTDWTRWSQIRLLFFC